MIFYEVWQISPQYVGLTHARDHPNFNRISGCIAAHIVCDALIGLVLAVIG